MEREQALEACVFVGIKVLIIQEVEKLLQSIDGAIASQMNIVVLTTPGGCYFGSVDSVQMRSSCLQEERTCFHLQWTHSPVRVWLITMLFFLCVCNIDRVVGYWNSINSCGQR